MQGGLLREQLQISEGVLLSMAGICIRKTNNITNADLCNKFADEIYLPKIVLKKADIPLSLRSQFIDLR